MYMAFGWLHYVCIYLCSGETSHSFNHTACPQTFTRALNQWFNIRLLRGRVQVNYLYFGEKWQLAIGIDYWEGNRHIFEIGRLNVDVAVFKVTTRTCPSDPG